MGNQMWGDVSDVSGEQESTVIFLFSKDRKLALMGLQNGAIRVTPLDEGADVAELGDKPSWTLNMHDNHYGRVTHITTSYDNRFLFTVSLPAHSGFCSGSTDVFVGCSDSWCPFFCRLVRMEIFSPST